MALSLLAYECTILQLLWNIFSSLKTTLPEWFCSQGQHQNSARYKGVWWWRKNSIIPGHSRRIEKSHQSVASNLACNHKKMEREPAGLASRVVNEGTLAEWNACQKQGPINIPWHPIDFSKWVPFLICKSSWWCFMLCLSLCIQCALSTFKFLLFPSNNHTQSTIYLNTPQLTEAFKHEAYKTFPLQEAGCLRKLVQITVMKMDRGTSWTVTRPRIECWSVLRLVQAGSS